MSVPQSNSDVAIQAIYLMVGADAARNRGIASVHSGGWHMGQAELCVMFAEQMASFLNDPSHGDFPGVFNYEVTEEMGTWLMHHQQATRNEFRVELDRVFLKFMSQ